MTGDPSPWMLLPEVQRYARCGRTEVLEALHDGRLRGHQTKPGGRWRINREDVDGWLRGEPMRAAATRGARAS